MGISNDFRFEENQLAKSTNPTQGKTLRFYLLGSSQGILALIGITLLDSFLHQNRPVKLMNTCPTSGLDLREEIYHGTTR